MSRLSIDLDRCTGHGRCYDLAPDLFEPDDFGHGSVARVIDRDVIDEHAALIAVRACPESAIRFEP